MSEADVRQALGDPHHEYPGIWFYDECSLSVNFDELDGGKVNFIELVWSGPKCDVRYQGVSVFDTPAEELVRVISGELPTTEADTFKSYELDLALWRPMLPSDYSPEDPDDEYRKGVYWQTIGIGSGHFLADAMAEARR